MMSRSDLMAVGRWFKKDFGEWFVGSWALLIGWGIAGTIFVNFLIMDGHFSRGLGEGSGVDPSLFQHIGWMFRCFAAVFLVLAVKMTALGMKDESIKLKWLGAFCTIIVVLHAMGFGLKALEGKRSNAVAIEQVADVAVTSNVDVIASLERQKQGVIEARDTAVARLQESMNSILNDRIASNDHLADVYREDQKEERDAARDRIDAIDAEITRLTIEGGARRETDTQAIATAEPWAPLFVGLAQLATWTQTPDDWWVYVMGVAFLMFWILVGDAIVIFTPPALYRMHLMDAKRRKLSEAGALGGRTTARRNRVRGKLTAIEDLRKEKAATKADLDAEDELTDELDREGEPEPEPEPEIGEETRADLEDDVQPETEVQDEPVEDEPATEEPDGAAPADEPVVTEPPARYLGLPAPDKDDDNASRRPQAAE